MQMDISGNSALVSASSSGLGKAAAKALAENGVNVVINGRDEDKLDEAVSELNAATDAEVVGCQGDLTEYDDIEAMVETAVEEFGGLDHLVTNAGGPAPGSFLETSDEDWYQAYDLLVMSVVRLVREAAPHLKEGDGGSIVSITSKTVKEAIPMLLLSNSVRMSVIGLEKTLSQELAPEVRANAVMPGPYETARIEEQIEHEVEKGRYDSYEEGIGARSESVPLNRMGEPRELGETIAFLCSDHASYINGAAIPVDGGSSKSNL
ncbi:SDR family oxidoreductase [Natrarchaeobius oligotrophus]|uniref:SDR family oxidoreductase n=1 Tax=Natrarchaeobius chitinivorans TaxID=1679083 RepID=A0A3N6M750_NATCH|nr:SDR family oxidoreductase [Natrarchaeobius chitinivorans]RQG99438.1 SDR family oxidoreductase [Natrarchaeobius chitinivorans]